MADPISITLIAATALSTAMGAASAIGSGNAQAANYQAEQNAQNYNAQLYQQQSEQAMAQASERANVQSRQATQVMGQQRAATAQSGLGFIGTGAELIDQSASMAELDRQNILYEGLLTGQGLQSQSVQSTYAAQVAGSQIQPSITGGYMSAAGSILGGVASGMGQYASMGKASGGGGFMNPNAMKPSSF